jgi:hypothetical protein
MKSAKKLAPQGLTPRQVRYLRRQFLRLYLLSQKSRDDFDLLVAQAGSGLVAKEHPRKQVYHLDPQQHRPGKKAKRLPETQERAGPMPILLEAKLSLRTRIRVFCFKTRARRLVFRFIVVCLLINAVQLAYPKDWTMPLARLQGNGFVGFSSKDQILSRFQNFDGRTLTVHTHTKNLTTSYSDLGVTLQADATVDSLTKYTLTQRFIPFSLFVIGNKTHYIHRDLNANQLSFFVRDVVAENNEPPRDATVSIEGTKISVNPSKPGYEYQYDYMKSLVLNSDLRDKAQLVFKPTVLPPAVDSSDIANKIERMQRRINTPLIIRAEAASMTVDPSTMASWVEVVPNPGQRTLDLVFSKPKIAQTLAGFPGQVNSQMQPSIVTMLNGLQAGRKQGAAGKVLQLEELIAKVADTTTPTIETIIAPVTTVAPSEVFDRRYSKDTAGLQNLIDYWTSNNKGQYSIDVRSLNGRIQAGKNQFKLSSSVGIFRIYIAHMVYGRIAAKSISPATPTNAGLNVGGCLERMMRDADESCTNALGDIVGWGAVDNILHDQGFFSTTLTRGAGLTTASDTSEWMTKLLNGSLTSRAHADELTSIMKRSNVRSGIPAGSSGIAVANRAGSFGRVKHDVGIVYHPKGAYVVSILTDGAEFSQIADLAREIRKVMDQ